MNRTQLALRLAALGLPLVTACSSPTLADRFRGAEDASRETMLELVARGPEAIPELELALEDEDPAVRARVRETLGTITGQWGSKGALIWKRSVADGVNAERPLLVLHLFGNFDEEFC